MICSRMNWSPAIRVLKGNVSSTSKDSLQSMRVSVSGSHMCCRLSTLICAIDVDTILDKSLDAWIVSSYGSDHHWSPALWCNHSWVGVLPQKPM